MLNLAFTELLPFPDIQLITIICTTNIKLPVIYNTGGVLSMMVTTRNNPILTNIGNTVAFLVCMITEYAMQIIISVKNSILTVLASVFHFPEGVAKYISFLKYL